MTHFRVGIIPAESDLAHITTLCAGCLEELTVPAETRLIQRPARVECEFCLGEIREEATARNGTNAATSSFPGSNP